MCFVSLNACNLKGNKISTYVTFRPYQKSSDLIQLDLTWEFFPTRKTVYKFSQQSIGQGLNGETNLKLLLSCREIHTSSCLSSRNQNGLLEETVLPIIKNILFKGGG